MTPPAILDVERVQAGEGEVVAARRLVTRVVGAYGRLLDVIVAAALYLETPFITTVLAAGKHVVVVMKQQARTLYQDADELRELHAPRTVVEGPRTNRRRTGGRHGGGQALDLGDGPVAHGGGSMRDLSYLPAARQLGAVVSISKPFECETVLATVTRLLES